MFYGPVLFRLRCINFELFEDIGAPPLGLPNFRMLLKLLAKVISFALILIGNPPLLCLLPWPMTCWVWSYEPLNPLVPPIPFPYIAACGKLGILVWLFLLLIAPFIWPWLSSSDIWNPLFFPPCILLLTGVSPFILSYGRPFMLICLLWFVRFYTNALFWD